MFRRFAKSLVLLLAILFPAAASALPKPEVPAVLTISGQVGHAQSDTGVVYDLAMLERMDVRTFKTRTIWVEGDVQFTGVPLYDLLRDVGAYGHHIEASASNDYKVNIPLDSITETAPMVAFEMNGKPMSRRGKGPFWIVYPYDSDPKFRTEVIYSRSVWQLDRIVVKE